MERVIIITESLLGRPYQLFSLQSFCSRFQVSKSTISEDLNLIKKIFEEERLGLVETISGPNGGVRFRPLIAAEDYAGLLENISNTLSDPQRILPGGFIYMTDIIFDPHLCYQLGRVFFSSFSGVRPDYIITMETKGIPLALMTARICNCPLVTIRRSKRVTEGSVVSINYVSGSSRRIQTMSLARRALAPGSGVLIIDDFMKAGGTARGILDLMEEFEAEVLGLGVLISTSKPKKKLVSDYLSLLILEEIKEEEGRLRISVNSRLKGQYDTKKEGVQDE